MRPVTRFLLPTCVAAALFLFSTVPATHAASVVHSNTSRSNSASLMGTIKAQLLAAINSDRAAHGLPSLSFSTKQSRCSTRHAEKMATANALFHTDLKTDVCSSHTVVGQNVGVDAGAGTGAVLAIHQMMMAEGACPHAGCPGAEFEVHGHYVNLMSHTARHIGIGLVVNNGSLWLTEDFTT